MAKEDSQAAKAVGMAGADGEYRRSEACVSPPRVLRSRTLEHRFDGVWWRARCGESRTPGSEGGPGKRAG